MTGTVIIPYSDYNPDGDQPTPHYADTVEVKDGSPKQMRTHDKAD